MAGHLKNEFVYIMLTAGVIKQVRQAHDARRGSRRGGAADGAAPSQRAPRSTARCCMRRWAARLRDQDHRRATGSRHALNERLLCEQLHISALRRCARRQVLATEG